MDRIIKFYKKHQNKVSFFMTNESGHDVLTQTKQFDQRDITWSHVPISVITRPLGLIRILEILKPIPFNSLRIIGISFYQKDGFIYKPGYAVLPNHEANISHNLNDNAKYLFKIIKQKNIIVSPAIAKYLKNLTE